MTNLIEPFHINIDQSELDDLTVRLTRTRWPEAATVDDNSQGPPLAKLQALCAYWADSYDWRRCESWRACGGLRGNSGEA